MGCGVADADLFQQIRITENGSVCLGRSVVCDGFELGFYAAAFTHIHHERIDMFGTCMHHYPFYTSKITADLLSTLMEDTYSSRNQFHAVDYDAPQNVRFGERTDSLKLLEPGHLLGSSQVLLTTHDDLKLLYSGDVSPQDAPPKCDALAIGSTRGDFHLAKADRDRMEHKLVDAVLESMASQKPVCIHAHRAKLLRIMHLLSEHGEMPADTQFLSYKYDMRVAEIYKKHGYRTRNLVDLHSYEGDEITTGEYPWVEFTASMEQTPREKKGRVSQIAVGGTDGNVVMEQDGREIWMASNERAECADLLKYVGAAEPRAVVTDGNTQHGKTLADAIKTSLGIEARPMPS